MTSVFSKAKPTCNWCDVTTTLADFAIITYAVSSEKLARYLPDGFEPDIFTLADGTKCSFVSAVPFRDLDFRFECIPWAKFSFGQTNYRAYVRYKGKRCVWFFGTSLGSVFVNIPRHLWRLPWHPAKMKFATTWSDEFTCVDYSLHTEAVWGTAKLRLSGTKEVTGVLDGFADAEETAEVLTHPLDGFYYRSDGKIGTYSIWHGRLDLRRAVVQEARFAVFEELGLIDSNCKPHSALVQKETEFVILLPPKPLITSVT